MDLAIPPQLKCGPAGCEADAAAPGVDQRIAALDRATTPPDVGTPAADRPPDGPLGDGGASDARGANDASSDAPSDAPIDAPSALDGVASDGRRPSDGAPMDGGSAVASDADPEADVTVLPPGADASPDAPGKGNGVTCTIGSDCSSGSCENGVCCATTCGPCRACNLPGSVGTCAPLAAGTMCRAASCSLATLTPASTCDGAGTCQASPSTACAPYVCAGPIACRTNCITAADCVAPNECIANVCRGNKASGQSCAGDNECQSNHCEQGVCCNSDCALACNSCNLPGSVGRCMPIPAGQDPLMQCADMAASTCGTTGMCNGAGACATWAQGTACAPPACTNGRVRTASTCNSSGTCTAPSGTWCVNYPCDTGGLFCKADCTNDSECVAPAKCVGGKCGGLKGQYFDGIDPAAAGQLKITRIDAQVNFLWDAPASPDQNLFGQDTFSVRWSGKVVPRFSETYSFITYSDDGVRLWVNGVRVIESWTDHPEQRNTGVITLQADTPYDIVLEYYQNISLARVRLLWSSAREPEQLIPQGRLIPAP